MIITRGGAGTELPLQADDADGGASGPFLHLHGRMHPELFTLPYQPSWQAAHLFRAPERICRTFTISLRTKPMAQWKSAGQFSALSKAKRAEDFVNVFAEEYPWIENINVEVEAGAPLLYATLKYAAEKQSLT